MVVNSRKGQLLKVYCPSCLSSPGVWCLGVSPTAIHQFASQDNATSSSSSSNSPQNVLNFRKVWDKFLIFIANNEFRITRSEAFRVLLDGAARGGGQEVLLRAMWPILLILRHLLFRDSSVHSQSVSSNLSSFIPCFAIKKSVATLLSVIFTIKRRRMANGQFVDSQMTVDNRLKWRRQREWVDLFRAPKSVLS